MSQVASSEYLEKVDRLRGGSLTLLTETAHVSVWQVNGDTGVYMVTVMSLWAAEARGLARPWSCQCKFARESASEWKPCSHALAAILEHADRKGLDFGQGLPSQRKEPR